MIPIWLPQNLGFIKGVNNALELLLRVYNTDAEYIVLLNNDVVVTDGWLNRIRRVFELNKDLSAVGPVTSECSSWQSFHNAKHVIPSFQIPAGFERLGLEQRAEQLEYCYGELAGKCRMLAFFCTVFKTSVFKEIGFLDEEFGVGYGDDDDLCKRMRDANMQLALSMGTYVWHNHQSTFKKIYSEKEIHDMRKERLALYEVKHGESAII
jgi:GT2 family glycosyltransferase